MANFCRKCGSALRPGAKFCMKCGSRADGAAPPPQSNSQTYTSPPPAPAPMPVSLDAPAAEQPKGGKPRVRLSAGSALMAAFISVECLPYLLKAVLFSIRKNTLGTAAETICNILGYLAAGLLLLLASKQITGRKRPAFALMLPSLIAAERALAVMLTLPSPWDQGESLLYAGLSAGVKAVFAGLAVIPLTGLFVPRDGRSQRGRIIAGILAFLSLAVRWFLPYISCLIPLTDTSSFISTLSYKLIGAFLEAALMYGAAAVLVRKRGAQRSSAGSGNLTDALSAALGLAAAVFAVAGVFISSQRLTVTQAAAKDIETVLMRTDLYSASGNMNEVIDSYKRVSEHCAAWRAAAKGQEYIVPDEYSDDEILQYLACVTAEPETVRDRVITSMNEYTADLWCPLMLDKYRSKEEDGKLSEKEREHIKELVSYCVANECFTFAYPLPEDIKEEKKDIIKALADEDTMAPRIRLAELAAAVQCGDSDLSKLLSSALDSAEEFPEYLDLQLFAATVGSENRWDGAGHYDRTAEAVLRWRELWFKEFGEEADDQQRSSVNSTAATMLLNMAKYDKAAPILEKTLENLPDSKDVMLQLQYCYSAMDENDKSYELTKKLYQLAPDEVTVLRSYCIDSVKHGEGTEAVEAASKLADMLTVSFSDNESGVDEILFNCVLYIALNDDSYWTDYTYRIFNGENTDPAVMEAIKKNEFLYNYINAVYYEKQCRDPETARDYARALLDKQDRSARLWYLNAMIAYDSERFDDALEYYRRADELEPDDPSILFGLANTYDAKEEYKAAYSLCRRILAMFPNGTDHSDDMYGVSAHARNLYNSLRGKLEEGDL
ncbi:MAG: tetratricopeptide repeat protein [Ruminococcus sp.]|nr:tetratricopeptide repeat protein [Ruminococcus sp.]